MIALYALLFRILSGEKYASAPKENTKLWLACLAAVPPCFGIVWLVAKIGSVGPFFGFGLV